MQNPNVGVIIGRFQPVTLEQIERLFSPAISDNNIVVVILGSSDTARDSRDPFVAAERSNMIDEALADYGLDYHKVEYRRARDYWYNKTRFLTKVQEAVSEGIKSAYGPDHRLSDCNITLYGVDRRHEETDYLNSFPRWNSEVEVIEDIESRYAEIMHGLYMNESNDWMSLVASSTSELLSQWIGTEHGKNMAAGHKHILKYRSKYDPLEGLPKDQYLWIIDESGERIRQISPAGHKLQFMTTDNVVIHQGNILLVRRRSHPGKGLWALPGGFLEADETAVAGAKRELQEETRMKVRDEWLTKEDRFDHPKRSQRGRVLTHAFRWDVPSWFKIPQLKPERGFEREVTRVQWFALSEVINDMPHLLFEDHLDIIESMAY